ncbi:NAD+ synthase [Balneolaceae bacterium ANBcel3]|nr:NAD+ synthase [Balneolaceae bacterium ANBcel3]
MRVRLQQINGIVGDIRGNVDAIMKALEDARKEGIDLLILPEMVVCGYPPLDLMERPSFLSAIFASNEDLIQATGETALLFGTVTPNGDHPGRPVYNSALLAHQGKCVGKAHKTLLPTYDVFDEFRYFEPAAEREPVEWAGIKWGITICEDIWNNQNEGQYHTYRTDPAGELMEKGAELIVNISASPFTLEKPEARKNMLIRQAKRLGLPLIYCNQVGANTELIFDGSSTVIGSDGTSLLQMKTLEEDAGDIEWKSGSLLPNPVKQYLFPDKQERLFKALVIGLRDYVHKSGMPEKVVLGLSGGIDSALTATIATEALGKEQVLGVTMPSRFSSEGSVSDSHDLANNLGIQCLELSIKDAYTAINEILEPVFRDTEFDVAEENIQSRIRGTLLMAISNKFGHMLLNTGNKSELAVGYCTLYGDMAGGLSVLADVYKTDVFALSRWLNTHYYQKEIIPWPTINKPPSAELRPDQKDSDSLPEYDILDGILKAYIEGRLTANEIVALGYPSDEVKRVITMVDKNEYKRRQAAPGLRVSSKAFGSGRRLPIVQRWHEPI